MCKFKNSCTCAQNLQEVDSDEVFYKGRHFALNYLILLSDIDNLHFGCGLWWFGSWNIMDLNIEEWFVYTKKYKVSKYSAYNERQGQKHWRMVNRY